MYFLVGRASSAPSSPAPLCPGPTPAQPPSMPPSVPALLPHLKAHPAELVSQAHSQQSQLLSPDIPHFLRLSTFINLSWFPFFPTFLSICFVVSSSEFSLLFPTVSILGPASLYSLKCLSQPTILHLALAINQILLLHNLKILQRSSAQCQCWCQWLLLWQPRSLPASGHHSVSTLHHALQTRQQQEAQPLGGCSLLSLRKILHKPLWNTKAEALVPALLF